MPRIVITDGFTNAHDFKLLTDAGCELVMADCLAGADIVRVAAEADGIIVGGAPIDAAVIAALKRCKIIVRGGVGYDDIDLDAARAAGIAVCNVPTGTTDEVADHTLALALALARNLPQMDGVMRHGGWDMLEQLKIRPLDEMLFVVLGFGNIGRAVLRRARGFKFRLGAFDLRGSHRDFSRLGASRMTLDNAIAQADILSLHLPLLPVTKHIVNAERILQMKPGAIIINTGRGGLVDTDALVAALQAGHLAAAGLDVFEDEPLPAQHVVRTLSNVLITPHLAAYSDGSTSRVARHACEETLRALRGEALKYRVNGRARKAKK